MPTPVSTAKQCLNLEASHALDEAVSVARRRGHSQTTSLHAVSALLSLPPSQLKEACVRARNAAFYPRVQLKALDFCLSVSLDRLPAASQPRVDEPPVSNSLMAAIKRSQANQRRQPESITAIRNHNQEHLGTSSGVKVELQHLIVSILDDPIVSRVFNDAGFRSFDVKLAILRPFQSFFRYPQRGRGHQGLFLCNLDGSLDSGYRPFPFPFSGHEDYRRIGEVFARKKGRNPLLVGVCANDALRSFLEILDRRNELDMLPLEIRGIKVVSVERDVVKFVKENWSDEAIGLRFRELGMMVEQSLGPGLLVSFGNLRYFLGGENGVGMTNVLNSVVRKLSTLLEVHVGKVWLIGFAANDQTYMELLRRFPSIDRDWDLHLLPITSVKPLVGGESCFKSRLMGSFVPFGGFFSAPSDLKVPFSSSYQHATCRNECNENFEQETTSFPKRGFMASLGDQHKNSLSPWLRKDEPGVNNASNDLKAKGGKMLLGDMTESLKGKQDNGIGSYHSEMHSTTPLSNVRSSKNDVSKVSENHSRTDLSPMSGSWLCVSGVDDSRTSPSAVSVVTELGLDLFPDPYMQHKKEKHAAKYSTHSVCDLAGKPDFSNYKTVFEALFERVGRQSEAVKCISQIIADSCSSYGRLQSSGLRGDIWLNCIGPDLFGKRKIARALAKTLYGSENNFIHVDFYSKHGLNVFGDQIADGSDVKFRGKTKVDHIVEELRKTPFGIVFLENVQSADPMAQRNLSQAIKTGRFSDSHGREVLINNRIFVLTSEENSRDKKPNFLEERIARAKGWPIQITVKTVKNIHSEILMNKRKLNGIHERNEQGVNVDSDLVKRPNNRGSGMSLDLNLPAELSDSDEERCDSWLKELTEKTLVQVVFDPFDYDALASKLLKWVHQSLCKAVGFGCSLEIEPRVMDQILAAVCLSEGEKEVKDWIDRVLGNGFVGAHKRYQLTAHSVVTVISRGPLYASDETCLLPSNIVLT